MRWNEYELGWLGASGLGWGGWHKSLVVGHADVHSQWRKRLSTSQTELDYVVRLILFFNFYFWVCSHGLVWHSIKEQQSLSTHTTRIQYIVFFWVCFLHFQLKMAFACNYDFLILWWAGQGCKFEQHFDKHSNEEFTGSSRWLHQTKLAEELSCLRWATGCLQPELNHGLTWLDKSTIYRAGHDLQRMCPWFMKCPLELAGILLSQIMASQGN